MFDKELIDAIRDKIINNEETIAVAESVTAGFLQAALSTAKDAACFFQGGITAYNLGQKYRHLLVDPIHAQSCDCVSQQVANAMAKNVCDLFGSDWGIGICGYAAPAPESNDLLFAYYAIVYKEKIVSSHRVISNQEEGPPTQLFYIQTILEELNSHLQEQPISQPL